MTMTSYGSEGLAYPLREAWVTGRQGIMRRFVGPVCGALRMEREARGIQTATTSLSPDRCQSRNGHLIDQDVSQDGSSHHNHYTSKHLFVHKTSSPNIEPDDKKRKKST